MKRHQIRRMLAGNVSDAQIRKTIADLGLSADDNHDYSEDEAKQIISQFKGTAPSTTQQPMQDAPDASGAIAHIAQFREQTGEQMGSEVVLAQQAVAQDLQRFEQSAHATAQAIAQRKALIVASFPGLVDSYALAYLRQIDELQKQAQQGFTTTQDLNNWVESMTTTTLAPNTFTLPGRSAPSLKSAS